MLATGATLEAKWDRHQLHHPDIYTSPPTPLPCAGELQIVVAAWQLLLVVHLQQGNCIRLLKDVYIIFQPAV